MYLGIDIGTSCVKAVVAGDDGTLAFQASVPLSVSRPEPLWSEQDPGDWWAATEASVLAIPAEMRAKISAIGLAGQMHGATLLGNDDRPLRPAILWNDGRSYLECAELENAEPRARAITGNIAMPGFTAPKLSWLRKHDPDLFADIACVLLPKDFVRLCMTGEKASDLSDSAGTFWLDVAARRWSEVMLSATGLSHEQMPRLYEGTELTGQLRPDVAARWGMASVPVAAGGGDNAASATGVGVIAEGDALLSLGTSGVIFAATGAFRPHPEGGVHAFCHCLPGIWHQMAVHLSAASCLDWAARQLGVAGPEAVLTRAEEAGIAGGPEIFLPYLSGERTPHNDPRLRAAFCGMDHETSPGLLAAAVLEGVAFAHADGLDALARAGTRVDELMVVGGGSRSRHWGAILSAALNVRLIYPEGGDVGPALGAARLAQIALTGASPEDICRRSKIVHAIEPAPDLVARLAPKLARFRAAYSAARL